ncbi:54S ribosomal protein L4 mitochondrial [Quaeritorhiza haematococci]|nr:54S ribosomal protein L4 mitochondrial [Quaeritorhiza haematococci]
MKGPGKVTMTAVAAADYKFTDGEGNEVDARLNPRTPVLTMMGQVEVGDVAQYQDKENLWWKSRTVQAWLHSFSSPSPSPSTTPLGLLELDRSVFGLNPIRQDLIKRGLKYEWSWLQQGTESSKNLGQVRGSTRKPFPQKGRGKARVGTLRAPQFRGGYTVHGPRPHNKSTDIQQKVYDAAIRNALSTKYSQDQLFIVDSLSLPTTSKSALLERLQSLGIAGRKCYFLYGNEEPEVQLVQTADMFLPDYKAESEEEEMLLEQEEEELTEKMGGLKGKKRMRVLVSNVRNVAVGPLMENEFVVLDKAAVEVLEEMYRVE